MKKYGTSNQTSVLKPHTYPSEYGINILPKKWNKLTQKEQLEWINSYFMPKQRIPEPYPEVDVIAKGQKIKTERGLIIDVPQDSKVEQKNSNIRREFKMWIGTWLLTIFHDNNCPATKFIAVSNPHSGKAIAQELSFEVLTKLNAVYFKIGNKYGLIHRKKAKSPRKKRNFTLSLSISKRGKK
jgi:hypothetical protein